MKVRLEQSLKLSVLAFVTGFVLMAYELVAARILAPSIGSSTYVWTSVIGTIIAALSFGYYLGGKLADARARAADIALLCLLSALAIAATLVLYPSMLIDAANTGLDVRIQGILASFILFVPASLLLGMISPYLVKLRITSLEHSGRSVASLSALNSIGGILGTFVTGFILFSYVGSKESLVVFILLMILSSFLFTSRKVFRLHVVGSLIITFFLMLPLLVNKSDVISIDTASARYEISEVVHGNGRTVRLLSTGPNGSQSGAYIDSPNELAFWYTKEMARATSSHPSPKRILMLGGGSFTLSSYLATKYPESTVDVVEIDPGLKPIAKQYFGYQDRPNVNLIFNDARTFVNQTQDKQYDVILVDVYSDTAIPFALVTSEYAGALKNHLAKDGLVIVNIVASEQGPCRAVLDVVDTAYKTVFSNAQVSFSESTSPTSTKNMVVVYDNSGAKIDGFESFDNGPGEKRLFTDNYAPIERLRQEC